MKITPHVLLSGLLVASGTCTCDAPTPADPCLEGDREACPCVEGFRLHASGTGCVPILPADDCAPGSRAAIGSLDCVPTGVTGCAAGFARDPSGWGCRAVLPEAPCTEGIEILGQVTCQTLGDCNAPFPPPEATFFVDDSFTVAELDSTHVDTISRAITLAPQDAVIAVEAGTYDEWLSLQRPVRIVGRCASQVVVRSASQGPPGLQAVNLDGISVQGLTLEGHEAGMVISGSTLLARELIVRGNRSGGVVAIDGSSVTLENTRVVGTLPRADGALGNGLYVRGGSTLDATACSFVSNTVNGVAVLDDGTRVTLRRSIVLETLPDGTDRFGKGAVAGFGGTLEIIDSAIVRNLSAGVSVIEGGHARIQGSVIDDTRADRRGPFGYGIEVDLGSDLEVDHSSITRSAEWAVTGFDAETRLVLRDSVLHGPEAGQDGIGAGIYVRSGAQLEVERCAILDSFTAGLRVEYPGTVATVRASLIQGTRFSQDSAAGAGSGLIVAYGAEARVEDSILRDNQTVGVIAGADDDPGAAVSLLALRATLIADTRADPTGHWGIGLEVSGAARAEAVRCSVSENLASAVVVGGTQARLDLVDSSVLETKLSDDGPGHAVVCADQGTLRVVGAHLLDNQGVGLAFGRAAGSVDSTVVARNQVGIHVQGGTVLRDVDQTATEMVAGEVQVSASSRFVDNAARLGSGEIPLPGLVPLAP
ncbi:MAG: right-handed parallel beta-helix repeat-containing protein [Pseudomonadota bacterium]